MRIMGLTGFPLGHSFSPAYFRSLFEQKGLHEWDYRLFPVEYTDELPALIRNEPNLVSLNVTVPHKKNILPLCDTFSPEVNEAGAANLVLIERIKDNGFRLHAHNTDVYGFRKSLENVYEHRGRKALLLGKGGSSAAVAAVLRSMGIAVEMLGRDAEAAYSGTDLSLYGLIVNCTPVGMKGGPDEGMLPLPYETAGPGQLFYDLVYNPQETPMIRRFREQGASVKNGMEMLHLQADKTWEIVSSFCAG